MHNLSIISQHIAAIYPGVFSWFPVNLFSYGEQGAWYDPSDFGTLFQDSAGTTPVTAVGQPVGLMLDKRLGLVLGAELVTNGTFNVDTAGWTSLSGGTGDVVGGEFVVTAATAYTGQAQTLPLVSGKTYEMILTSRASSGAIADCRIDGTGVSLSTTSTTNVVLRQIFVANANVQLKLSSSVAATTATFDNISVRELPGNHATQPTAINRPVLSARVNLLTKTEDFTDAVWDVTTKAGTGTVAKTPNYSTAPDGTTTACRVVASRTGTDYAVLRESVITTNGSVNTPSAWIKSNTGVSQTVVLGNNTTVFGVVTATPTWARITGAAAATDVSLAAYLDVGVGGASDNAIDVSIWHPSLVPADQANLPYQRVNTATDYNTVGFKHYLAFNGTNSWMSTGSIDFTATDKMTVVTGVRKLSDAAIGAVVELSASTDANLGAFGFFAPAAASATFLQYVRGDGGSEGYSLSGYASPITNVLALAYDIGGSDASTELIPRANALSPTKVLVGGPNTGTGNFGNYPLYIGARAGSSLFFNGNLYSMVIRGALSGAEQITSAETYANSKTGAY